MMMNCFSHPVVYFKMKWFVRREFDVWYGGRELVSYSPREDGNMQMANTRYGLACGAVGLKGNQLDLFVVFKSETIKAQTVKKLQSLVLGMSGANSTYSSLIHWSTQVPTTRPCYCLIISSFLSFIMKNDTAQKIVQLVEKNVNTHDGQAARNTPIGY
jgi:hypothetical protein